MSEEGFKFGRRLEVITSKQDSGRWLRVGWFLPNHLKQLTSPDRASTACETVWLLILLFTGDDVGKNAIFTAELV